MRNKLVIVCMLVIVLSVKSLTFSFAAEIKKPVEDSKELQFQDMLVLLLLPYINGSLAEVYAKYLNTAPDVYPYFVDVKHVERVNGFRGFDFLITLGVTPTVGPHIPVGEDLFTYEISPVVKVKLVNYEHIKGPKKTDFPPNYQDFLKK
ncbi:DUF3888 domain-containing protein [Paenibacillus sp. N3.4]|uniref:DUF3888 domain-containing protein n=1 Tax=Paenibacillus sp. N3.4 TaxID=2603222 RepID=UPI0011CCA2B1|nr:DUF3888 domain-containing protein [Paenibacillus sp. N3.4]TXK71673.1 DUF3888 domain-containing protein [Paenibacillus sp. N3.4]TXK71691.1 DUF3888 domain-containing protein [Paenibacillus sp. N3.4]